MGVKARRKWCARPTEYWDSSESWRQCCHVLGWKFSNLQNKKIEIKQIQKKHYTLAPSYPPSIIRRFPLPSASLSQYPQCLLALAGPPTSALAAVPDASLPPSRDEEDIGVPSPVSDDEARENLLRAALDLRSRAEVRGRSVTSTRLSPLDPPRRLLECDPPPPLASSTPPCCKALPAPANGYGCTLRGRAAPAPSTALCTRPGSTCERSSKNGFSWLAGGAGDSPESYFTDVGCDAR